MAKIGEQYQQDANVASLSTARLATVVISALGSKNSRITVTDFLPFPDAMADTSNQPFDLTRLHPSPDTIRIFLGLLARGELPTMFAGQLGKNVSRWRQSIDG